MTSTLATITHRSTTVSIRPQVLAFLKLESGQRVDEATMWLALDLDLAAKRAEFEAIPVVPNELKTAFNSLLDVMETVVAKHRGAA